MTERIIRAVAELPKVCEHFNIPVQAADNEILAAMRRGYTIEEYREWVQRIREIVPGASLSTDVIVGFCGETEAQFQKVLDLLEEVRFDKVHVAAYSPRPGTIAWRQMEDTVPQEEKMRRLHAVEQVQERIAAELNAALEGSIQEVLVETVGKDGKHSGRTRTNKLVHFQGQAMPGGLVQVRIEKTSPWSLQGSPLESTAPAPA
ncbi:MAG TPA: radical SAM protein, partial [Dehalococcoidia bacterium]|nr:radical SAM protein [Dehalococcoidia bacterium]